MKKAESERGRVSKNALNCLSGVGDMGEPAGWRRRPSGMKWTTGGSCIILAGALLTAGCASPVTGSTASRSTAQTATVIAGGGSVGGTPEQRAAAEAKVILASFVVPPGAVRLAKRPPLPNGSPGMAMESTTQQDAVVYWQANGQPTALLAWEEAHISRSYSRQDVIIGPPSWNTVYTLPPVPGVLPMREMNVQVYDAGSGKTDIMAEAMVSWAPPRTPAEVIPASVRVVTIAASGPWRGNPGPVTITSAPTVRQLAALVDNLPVATVAGDNMSAPCPMGTGFTLTFRAAGGGAPVAVADGPAECGVVHFTLNGKDLPDLQAPDSYRAAVLQLAGLHWQLG